MMNNKKKKGSRCLFIGALIVLVMSVLLGGAGVKAEDFNRIFNITNYYEAGYTQSDNLGGDIYNRPVSFDAGIRVNGTEIINSSGVYVGTVEGTIATTSAAEVGSLVSLGAITGEAITGSSTLSLTGAATLASSLDVAGETRLASSSATTFIAANGFTGTCLAASSTVVVGGIITACN